MVLPAQVYKMIVKGGGGGGGGGKTGPAHSFPGEKTD